MEAELEWPQRVRAEIADLHDFFEGWLAGTISGDALDAGTAVLDEDFALVTPRGDELTREALLEKLRAARGLPNPPRLWVENVHLQWVALPLLVARYEECQETPTERTRRISTVVFRQGEARHGLIWCRVHETWKPEEE